jgi:superfamily II DNA or RNA helicase
MPTGAGKTILAVMAILRTQRSTLVVVPTIELLHQWHDTLKRFFATPIGMLGGGMKTTEPITISTYDSAQIYSERLGNQFGLLICDECHHLPAPQYRVIAETAIAPFRLGLTATVERSDGGEQTIYELMGPRVFEGRIDELVEKSLAPYDVVTIEVDLTPEEREAYDDARQKYIRFVGRMGIDFRNPQGWKQFLFLSSRSREGREAFEGYLKQKSLAQSASGKFDALWDIFVNHAAEKMIVFTHDNAMAYAIGARFFLPVITHKTKDHERKAFLEQFREGRLKVLVTSRVLNEGVDVPDASVGVVASGSGAVREHVQRLGRILRHLPGKRATLYELLASGTGEIYVNQRRRNHHAYEGSHEIQGQARLYPPGIYPSEES